MTPLPRPVWPGGYVGPAPVLADPLEPRQPRRITQLTGNRKCAFALCDDGTAWEIQRSGYGWGEWHPLPSISQHQLPEGDDA